MWVWDVIGLTIGSGFLTYSGGWVTNRLILPPGNYAVITRTVLNRYGEEEEVSGFVTYNRYRVTGIQEAIIFNHGDFDLMTFYSNHRGIFARDNVLNNLCSGQYLKQEAFQSFVSQSRQYLESFDAKFRKRFGTYLDKLNESSKDIGNLPRYRKEVLRQQAIVSDTKERVREILSHLDLEGRGDGLPYGTREALGATHLFLNQTFDDVILINHSNEEQMLGRFYSLPDLRKVLDDEIDKFRDLAKETVWDYLNNFGRLTESISDIWDRFMASLPWEDSPILSGTILILVVSLLLVWGSVILVLQIKRLVIRIGQGLDGIVAKAIDEKESVKFTFVSRLLKASGILVTFVASLILSDQYDLLPDPVSDLLRRVESLSMYKYLGIDNTFKNWMAYLMGLDNVLMMIAVPVSLMVGFMIYLWVIARRLIRERRERKVEVTMLSKDKDDPTGKGKNDRSKDGKPVKDALPMGRDESDPKVSISDDLLVRIVNLLDRNETVEIDVSQGDPSKPREREKGRITDNLVIGENSTDRVPGRDNPKGEEGNDDTRSV